MRKELIFAIVAGTIFGLVVAVGIWRANSAIKLTENISSPTPTVVEENDNNSPQANSELGITLTKPEDKDVKAENSTEFIGITRPASWIVISAEDEDYIIQSDEKGEFSQEVELIGGMNQILLTSYDPNTNDFVEENLTIVHSTELKIDEE